MTGESSAAGQVRWAWGPNLIQITLGWCGHTFEDRPPRSTMRAREITEWLERLYAICPVCQRTPGSR
jgi:hypothetical protein